MRKSPDLLSERAMPFSFIDSLNPKGRQPGTAAALLTGVLESAMDAIMTVDEQHKIVMYNQAAEQMFGWTAQEILGQSVERLMPHRFRAGHGKNIENYSQTGPASRRLGRPRVIHGVRRNGEEFPLDASVSLLDTPEGKLFTVIIRDVTETDKLQREQAASYAKLHDSQRRLQAVQRLARIGYSQYDLDTRQLWWCDEACNLLGLDPALLDGSYEAFLNFIHSADRQSFDSERNAAYFSLHTHSCSSSLENEYEYCKLSTSQRAPG